MTAYVAGFLVSPDRRVVALIRKKRPDWQAGKLNGIGGHIEPGETPEEAMRREFREETGVDILSWTRRVELTGRGWCVNFFVAYDEKIGSVKTMTDEQVEIVGMGELGDVYCIPNLRWLIPLCMDAEIAGPVALWDTATIEALRDL